jgi:protein-S-isoprenylcysteine O-methyltransferase Ste14
VAELVGGFDSSVYGAGWSRESCNPRFVCHVPSSALGFDVRFAPNGQIRRDWRSDAAHHRIDDGDPGAVSQKRQEPIAPSHRLAFSATCLSLLARPFPGPGHSWDFAAVMLTMVGLSTQLYSKLTLGRRFGLVAANRGICCSGPYRIVRHPIYMGYVLLHSGFFMLNPTVWNFCVFAVLYSIKIPRILAEERLLGQDPDYQQYMQKVRSRLIPGLF